MTSIRDKSVLITGAGRGIGKRLAMGFAQAGARVGLLARSQAELDLAKLEIEHAGGNALRLRADVRDLEQVTAAVDRMRVVFGGVDVLIAAAAVQGPIGPFLSAKPKAWAETIETNLIGVVEFLPRGAAAHDREALRQDHPHRGRRVWPSPPQFQRLCRLQGRGGAVSPSAWPTR